jgi:hypothetical protein
MRESSPSGGEGPVSAVHRAPRVTRRRVLQIGAAFVLAAGGLAGIVRSRGYALPPGQRLTTLSAWQYVVVQSAARRIAAPDDARDGAAIPTADELDVAGFVDGWLAKMRPDMRRDFGRFLAYLEHLAPLRVGSASRFTRLPPEVQDRVLASIEASPVDLLRAGFDGLKALVFMGYYRDARTWGVLGYDGPLVGRPDVGWTAAARAGGGAP